MAETTPTPSDIRTMLQESVDATRRNRLTQMTRTLLALRPEDTKDAEGLAEYNQAIAASLAAKGATWPHYEPFRPSMREFQRINYIQNNLRILTAQTRAIDVVPQWVNTKEEIIANARAAWWQWRSQGLDGLGGWKTDFDNSFSDFAALGEGYLRCGMMDAETGKACTVIHYHPLNVMLDPYAKYTNESRWVAFSTVLSREEAEQRFPDFDYDQYTEENYQKLGVTAQGCRIIEYFAKKSQCVEGEYSHAAFAGSLSGQVIEEGDNPFGDVLPYQAFLGFIPSGTDIPVGMVAACTYIQEELDRIDDDGRKKSQRDNLLGLLPSLFNKDDLKSYADGKRPEFLRLDEQTFNKVPDMSKAIVTVPRNGENADQKARRGELQSTMQELSGITSLDMGQLTGSDVTATEVNQAASRGSAQVNFYSREFARGIQELASKVGAIARKYDTAPFCVNDDGIPVWYNSKDRRLTSKTIFDGPLNAVIGDEDLVMTDINNKRAKEGQKWLQILQVSQAPEAWKRYLISQGVKNPEDFTMPPPPQLPPQGGQAPQPGAMPPQMPQ